MTKRKKYNKGGQSFSVDVFASGTGGKKDRFSQAKAQVSVGKGPVSISHMEKKYKGKDNYGSFKGGDSSNSVSYSKNGFKATATYGKQNKAVDINKTFKNGLNVGAGVSKNKQSGRTSGYLSINKDL